MKSTIILLIGGIITKLMAIVIKIYLTRSIGNDGIGLYMLVLPTFNLFITLCTLSLPTSISKLISENNQGKKVILPLIPIALLYNFVLLILIVIFGSFIADSLLKNHDTYYSILGIGFTLPFICLSSMLKGYFYGKENMFPYIVSNILEQFVRLLFIIFVIPRILFYGISITVLGVVIINIFSEFCSIICLILFIPNKYIKFDEFKYDKKIFKDILNLSLSATGSRLIGSISYFLEPIILTYVLVKIGYSYSYIVNEYGIINGYVFPLLLIPSFFTMAISTSLLPVISSSLSKGQYKYAKNKLCQSIGLSLLVGIIFIILFMSIPNILLKFIYNTYYGVGYIRFVAPFFLLHYIQGPLTAYMQGANMARQAMIGTFIGAIIKNILLIILPFWIGIWGFIASSIINILFVTLHHLYYAFRSFKIS